MIRNHVRVRGASTVGARHEGDVGPFGVRPHEADEDGLDGGGQDDGEQQAEGGAACVTATDNGEEVFGGRVRYGCR